MNKEKFNPDIWLDSKENQANTSSTLISQTDSNLITDIETIVQCIESQQVDITNSYANWRDIGFAFSEELSEEGRNYFHRVSKFHPEYSSQLCDEQYNKCLRSKNTGITVKTFFHLAKVNGINVNSENFKVSTNDNQLREQVNEEKQLPNIPASVYQSLPDFLKEISKVTGVNHEKDVLLLGSIATISSCLPHVYGIYDNRKVYPNLYLFVTAKASAGKGQLNHCRQLVYPVHKILREESEQLKEIYNRDMNVYNASKKDNPDAEKPIKPPEKMLFIPANSSATGVFQLLDDNKGQGLIFETEGDTLANIFKSDYGNYSDGFRKAFHHESISYYRRTDREHVEIEKPCLSTVLSGTPKQIINLVPDTENGLFSRFAFYYLNIKNQWKNVFEQLFSNGLDEYFEKLGQQFFDLYHVLKTSPSIRFSLTEKQQNEFNKTFANLQDNYHKLLGDEYMATVRRLGLIAFRMAMIFSTLRILENGEMQRSMVCEDKDFNNAIAIIKVLIIHAKKVFSDLPEQSETPKRANRKQRFYDNLPSKFSRQDYVEVAVNMNIPDKTAQGYITKLVQEGLLLREKNDEYIKTINDET